MSISKTAATVRVSHIDARAFANNNKAQNKITSWENKFHRATGRAIDNAHHLQNIDKKDFGPNVAEIYQENKIRRLVNVESYIMIISIFIAASFAIGAMFEPLLIIVTIFTGWFSTIAYRFYSHHLKCYHHLLELNAKRCPYCHESLLVHTGKIV